MKPLLAAALSLVVLFTAAPIRAAEDDAAKQLAEAVGKAAGIENWPKVTRVKFTFNVVADGVTKMSAQHDWNVLEGTDTVKWADKSATANLWNPDENKGDAKAAYKRWVNDSYWLLMPLKLGDKGVNLKAGGMKDKNGKEYEVLELSFGKVGITSNDRYDLYIDPETKLVRFWDFMPKPEVKNTATWDEYVEKGGLNLSTQHKTRKNTITITDLEVTGS